MNAFVHLLVHSVLLRAEHGAARVVSGPQWELHVKGTQHRPGLTPLLHWSRTPSSWQIGGWRWAPGVHTLAAEKTASQGIQARVRGIQPTSFHDLGECQSLGGAG